MPYLKPDPDRDARIARLYIGGATTKEVAAEMGCGESGVLYSLKRTGTARRASGSPRLAINDHAFDSWDNSEAAYFAGWLFADGCISSRKKNRSQYVVVGIKEGDRSQLEKFKAFLQSGHAIGRNDSGGSYAGSPIVQFSFTSKRICERLRSIGIVKGRGPVLDDSLAMNAHFWRGVCDGDGNLYWSKPQKDGWRSVPYLGIVGHRDQMEQFRRFVQSVSPECGVSVRPDKMIHRVYISGEHAKAVAISMYKDAPVSLDRKQAIANTFMEWERFVPPVNSCTTPGCSSEKYKAMGMCEACYARKKYPSRRAYAAAYHQRMKALGRR